MDLCVSKLLGIPFHGHEVAIQVTLVKVEIVALEGITVHACVYVEEADVIFGVLSMLDHHLVVCRGSST